MNKSYRVLIVEDEKDICDLYAMHLTENGYQVIKAYNGTEALEKFNSTTFDIILLDIMLPDISGLDILKKFKEQKSTAKILILTNLTADKTINDAYDLGADGYLLKATLTRDSFMEEIVSYLED